MVLTLAMAELGLYRVQVSGELPASTVQYSTVQYSTVQYSSASTGSRSFHFTFKMFSVSSFSFEPFPRAPKQKRPLWSDWSVWRWDLVFSVTIDQQSSSIGSNNQPEKSLSTDF